MTLPRPIRVSTIILLSFVCVLTEAASFAAAAANSSSDAASPVELVRAAVTNEVAAANDNTAKHMFRSRKQNPQGSQTRLYVETRDAMAGMTVAYNDQPLSPEQMKGEEARLAEFVSNPDQLKHKHSQEQENAERTLRIVKALPEAFVYEFDKENKEAADLGHADLDQAGLDQAGPDKAGVEKNRARLVRLNFHPNPDYHPPSHVEDVLTGMQGFVLIDSATNRIARIDGTLFKEVSFGWGILGHLDKGGHFLVEQRGVADGSWQISRMSLTFTGKILLFKSIAIKSDEVFTDFRRVPATTTFVQGVEMLKAEEAKLPENHKTAAAATNPKPH